MGRGAFEGAPEYIGVARSRMSLVRGVPCVVRGVLRVCAVCGGCGARYVICLSVCAVCGGIMGVRGPRCLQCVGVVSQYRTIFLDARVCPVCLVF